MAPMVNHRGQESSPMTCPQIPSTKRKEVMTEGVKTEEGVVFAYDEFVLVRPSEDHGEIIVIQHTKDVNKGTILSLGEDVPTPICPGDLVWFVSSYEIEKNVLAVHFTNILAFNKFAEDE
jgi:hypothetical protein